MSEKDTNLVDAQGKEIKKVTIPVVHYQGFRFALDSVRADEIATITDKGVRPGDIIKELRAARREASDRFTILAAALAVAAKHGTDALQEYLQEIGLRISDIDGRKFYETEKNS